VRNAFSQTADLCPGVLASIYGTNFGSTPSGVGVTVGGKPAFIVSVTPGQLNVQIPMEATVGATTLSVSVSGSSSTPFNVSLTSYAPAFASVSGTGSGLASVMTVKNTAVTSISPAVGGDTLVATVTGLGATSPATATGVTPASPQRPTSVTPTLT